MGILEKLIFGILVIALPLGEVARISLNEVAVTLLDVGVAVAVFIWFILKRKTQSSHLNKPILIFALTLLLSLIANVSRLETSELIVSSLYLLRWILYSLLFFVVLDLSSLKKKIEKAMTIGGGILVFIGFIQYFLYPDLRNLYYAGWDEHLYRMFSSFLDPNFAGIFFVLTFLLIIDKLSVKPTSLLKLVSLVTMLAIILTFSRSAYIALVIGLSMMLFLKGKKIIAMVLILLFVFIVIATLKFSPKTEGTNLLRIASGEARLNSMRNAITIFTDHPIFGVGFNSYRYAQRDYGFLNEEKMIVHSGAGTDNSFLFVLATSGVVGFSAFLYLLFKIFSIKDSLVLSSISALVINSLFINSLFYPPIMLWMWLLVAIRSRNT